MNWLARHAGTRPLLTIDGDAIAALGTLDLHHTDALLVTDDAGHVVGTFERTAVLRWLQLRAKM